jgi:hypothetical protein
MGACSFDSAPAWVLAARAVKALLVGCFLLRDNVHIPLTTATTTTTVKFNGLMNPVLATSTQLQIKNSRTPSIRPMIWNVRHP